LGYTLKNIWVYKDQTNIKKNIEKEIKCTPMAVPCACQYLISTCKKIEGDNH